MIKEISVEELKSKLTSGERVQVIDIREPYEVDVASFTEINIPLGEIIKRENELSKEGIVVLHCQSGQRASAACESLERLCNRTNIFNLTGGLEAWLALESA